MVGRSESGIIYKPLWVDLYAIDLYSRSMSPNDTATRRRVLKLSGAAVAAAVGAGTAAANHFHADVDTDPATDVGYTSATLNGDLLDMGNASSVDVWFEWGQKGDGLPNSTTRQSRTSAGSFSEDVTVSDGTTYEFEAYSDTGSIVESGGVLEFTTDELTCGGCEPKE